MALTSEAADLFERQCASEQRRMVRLVMREAIWQDGELRTSFREPFEKLQLSNSATLTKDEDLSANEAISITGGEGGIRTHKAQMKSVTY